MAVQTQIQVRRGTAATWTSTNPTLAAGEIGFETDTGKFKIGTGSSVWTGLPYAGGQATSTTYQYVATAGQTTFSGADANGNTLAYTAGTAQVYLNGVLLINGTEYTASNGTSVVLTTAAIVDDRLTVIAPTTFTTSSDIPASNLSAKGSLVTATAAATPANLSVGADGTVLMANSSASSGLSYAGPLFTAGKNKIINGDFGVWQRGTSFSSSFVYTADRWLNYFTGTSVTGTYSQQTFTAGTAPVSGYEGTYFLQAAVASGSDAATQNLIIQRIEDVRQLAGQTVTMSFWAKTTSGTPKIGANFRQDFGSGGSTAVDVTGQSATLSTSWTRYSFTFSIPSVSGKTIGTSSFLSTNIWFSAGSSQATQSGSVGLQTATFQVWGVQVEAGSVATPFQTATGTIQGELAACQRYYWRSTAVDAYTYFPSTGIGIGSTSVRFGVKVPVTLRTKASSVDYSALACADTVNNLAVTALSLTGSAQGVDICNVDATVASGGTQYRPYFLAANNNTAAYIGFSAEL